MRRNSSWVLLLLLLAAPLSACGNAPPVVKMMKQGSESRTYSVDPAVTFVERDLSTPVKKEDLTPEYAEMARQLVADITRELKERNLFTESDGISPRLEITACYVPGGFDYPFSHLCNSGGIPNPGLASPMALRGRVEVHTTAGETVAVIEETESMAQGFLLSKEKMSRLFAKMIADTIEQKLAPRAP